MIYKIIIIKIERKVSGQKWSKFGLVHKEKNIRGHLETGSWLQESSDSCVTCPAKSWSSVCNILLYDHPGNVNRQPPTWNLGIRVPMALRLFYTEGNGKRSSTDFQPL